MLRPHELWLSDRGDQDIGGAGDLRQSFAARMDNGHGRIAAFAFSHEQECQRFSDDHAPAENHDVGAGNFDAGFYEKSLTTERRAWDETARIAER